MTLFVTNEAIGFHFSKHLVLSRSSFVNLYLLMTDLSLTIASNNLTTSCLSIVDFEYHFQFCFLLNIIQWQKHTPFAF